MARSAATTATRSGVARRPPENRIRHRDLILCLLSVAAAGAVLAVFCRPVPRSVIDARSSTADDSPIGPAAEPAEPAMEGSASGSLVMFGEREALPAERDHTVAALDLHLSVLNMEGRPLASSVTVRVSRAGTSVWGPEIIEREEARPWPLPALVRPGDVVDLDCRARGHAPGSASLSVTDSNEDLEITVHLNLAQFDRLRGRLVDGAGRPASPDRIRALLPEVEDDSLRRDAYGLWFVPASRTFQSSRRAVVNVADATFDFALPGEWRGDIVLLLDQSVIWSRPLERPFDRLDVDLDSCVRAAGTALRVRVDGARAADPVQVELLRRPFFAGRSNISAEAVVSTQEVVFPDLGPGRYEVRARAPGVAAAAIDVIAPGGVVSEVGLVLDAAHRLRVRARRPDGDPVEIEPWTVTVFDGRGRQIPIEVTVDDGVAHVDGVPEGIGWVAVEGNLLPISVPGSVDYEVVIVEDSTAEIVLGSDAVTRWEAGVSRPVDLEFLLNGVVPAFPTATYYFHADDPQGVPVRLPPGSYVVRGRSAGLERWRGEASVAAGRVERVVLERE